MEKLSVEEKAKRYELALERCKKLYNEAKANEYTSDIEDYETIFPELKEIEDEEIRKALVKYFTTSITDPDYEICGVPFKEVLAWLEKQSKDSPVLSNSSNTGESSWSEEDNKRLEHLTGWLYGHVGVLNGGKKKYAEWLSSIKDKTIPQPKQEWSEEDIRMSMAAMELITICPHSMASHSVSKSSVIDWLKSLRPQSQWKPDSSMLICLEYAIKHINKDGDKRILSKLLEQLKKL